MADEASGFWKAFLRRWASFILAVLDPWTFVLLLSAAMLVYGSSLQTDKRFAAVLTVAASLCSGLLGGVVAKKWGEHTERHVLIARGRSAIRNLRLLLSSIGTMEKRVEKYVGRLAEPNCSQDVVRTYLEEILDRCVVLHDEGINAIENWTDIIPEADITTQIGKIGDLQSRIAANMTEIDGLRQQLTESENRSEGEIRAAQERVREKKKEVQGARAELAKRRFALGNLITAPISKPSVIITNFACKDCGGTLESGRCAYCGKDLGWKIGA